MLLAGAVGCADSAADGSPDRTDVVAGFYPLAWAVEEIGGDSVEVTNLTPAGAEPHDLELSVRDVERVRGADLVLYLGEGFQPALAEAAAEAEGTAFDALAAVDARSGDPHVWLDPRRFAEIVRQIGAELDARPAAAKLAARLGALDREYARGLASCRRRELVTAHNAFGYLAERYGLEVVPIAGVSPETEPAPQDLDRVAEHVRARGATTIFVEPVLSPEVAEAVARETGARTALLDPLEGLTEEELERGGDYFSVMRANLAALREGLGCD